MILVSDFFLPGCIMDATVFSMMGILKDHARVLVIGENWNMEDDDNDVNA